MSSRVETSPTPLESASRQPNVGCPLAQPPQSQAPDRIAVAQAAWAVGKPNADSPPRLQPKWQPQMLAGSPGRLPRISSRQPCKLLIQTFYNSGFHGISEVTGCPNPGFVLLRRFSCSHSLRFRRLLMLPLTPLPVFSPTPSKPGLWPTG